MNLNHKIIKKSHEIQTEPEQKRTMKQNCAYYSRMMYSLNVKE